ncbi:MAG: hypothetical protein H6R26_3199, partial [Proteobacteria bacterium]|nr:hypothetical protein [Pseudomonadota bacterium]
CPFYAEMHKQWNEGIRHAFTMLPRFDWELDSSAT